MAGTGNTELRYPVASILPDYLRAGTGAAAAAALLVALDANWWVRGVLLAIAGLCALLALQAARRQRTRVRLDDDGIELGPGAVRIEWSALERARLAYYRVGRETRGGWMELTLGGGGFRITVDSRLLGFDRVVRAAFAAARRAGIELDPATRANVTALERVAAEGRR